VNEVDEMEKKEFLKNQLKRRLRGEMFAPFMAISPKLATQIAYFLKFKKCLNLTSPCNFNEKIQWLKLNYQTQYVLQAADKVAVRDILIRKGLEEYLTPALGIYNSPSEINWDILPQKFVIKTNNASGTNILVRDKEKVNRDFIIKQLGIWLRTNFSNYALEPQYSKMKPQILIEEYLESDGPLYDYRFFCFNGNPEFLYVSVDGELNEEGFSDKQARKGYFDFDFKRLYLMKEESEEFDSITKPSNFETMIEIARKLSEGIPFVRVDLYNVEGKIRFGEMTFTPTSGFADYYKDEVLVQLGEKIILPPTSIRGYQL